MMRRASGQRSRGAPRAPLDGTAATTYDAGCAAASAAGEPMIDTFKADLTQAMRRHDAIAMATLRMLISQVQYARIEAKRELTQDDYLMVLQRAVKTRRGRSRRWSVRSSRLCRAISRWPICSAASNPARPSSSPAATPDRWPISSTSPRSSKCISRRKTGNTLTLVGAS